MKSFLLSSRRFRSSREKTEQKRKRKNGPGRTLLEASKLSLRLFSSFASFASSPRPKEGKKKQEMQKKWSLFARMVLEMYGGPSDGRSETNLR